MFPNIQNTSDFSNEIHRYIDKMYIQLLVCLVNSKIIKKSEFCPHILSKRPSTLPQKAFIHASFILVLCFKKRNIEKTFSIYFIIIIIILDGKLE